LRSFFLETFFEKKSEPLWQCAAALEDFKLPKNFKFLYTLLYFKQLSRKLKVFERGLSKKRGSVTLFQKASSKCCFLLMQKP